MADTQNSIKCLGHCLKVLEKHKKLIEQSQTNNSVAIIKSFKVGVECARLYKDQSFDNVARQMTKAMLRASRGPSAILFSSLFKGAADIITEDITFEVNQIQALTVAGYESVLSACSRLGIDPNQSPFVQTIKNIVSVYEKNKDLDFISYITALTKICYSHAIKEGVTKENITVEDIIDADSFCLCLFWYAACDFSKELTLKELDIVEDEQIKEPVISSNYTYKVAFTIIRKNGLTIELLQRSLLNTGRIISIIEKDKRFYLHMLSNTPNHIISYALKFGDICDVEIINLKISA